MRPVRPYFSLIGRRSLRQEDGRSDKMRDEIDSRLWVAHGHAFSESVANFFAGLGDTIGTGLRRLNELEFDAPWKRDARGPGRA
jgi:hypothetical protein